MRKDPFLDAVAAIYDAALQPQAWPTALSRVGELLNSTWLMLSALRLTGEADLVAQDLDGAPEAFALFRDKYNTAENNPAIPTLMASPPGTITLREQQISDKEWHRIGLYKELYKPTGNYYALGAVVLKTNSHLVPLGVNRPRRRGAYTSQETNLLSQTIPHIRRAMQIHLQLADLQLQKTAHEELWDTLSFGVVLLDREGKVLWTNKMAAAVLVGVDGLEIQRGMLSAVNPKENKQLQEFVRSSVATSRGQGAQSGGPISVSRPSLARPFHLLVAPLRVERPIARQPAAVVFVTDPDRKSESAPELLERLYELTPREAAVAAMLMKGIELREAAGQLRMSMHTARTHLRLIFEKTNTHRQAELMRLLLRGPAGLH